MSLGEFDTSGVDPEVRGGEFGLIAKGDYPAEIAECNWKDARSGGRYLEVKYYLPELNRYLWDRLNLYNSNPKAVEIATQRLAQMRAATGRLGGQDGEEFIDCPVVLSVGVRKNRETGKDENVIWGVSPPQLGVRKPQTVQAPRHEVKSYPSKPAPAQPARQGWGKPRPQDGMPF